MSQRHLLFYGRGAKKKFNIYFHSSKKSNCFPQRLNSMTDYDREDVGQIKCYGVKKDYSKYNFVGLAFKNN